MLEDQLTVKSEFWGVSLISVFSLYFDNLSLITFTTAPPCPQGHVPSGPADSPGPYNSGGDGPHGAGSQPPSTPGGRPGPHGGGSGLHGAGAPSPYRVLTPLIRIGYNDKYEFVEVAISYVLVPPSPTNG